MTKKCAFAQAHEALSQGYLPLCLVGHLNGAPTVHVVAVDTDTEAKDVLLDGESDLRVVFILMLMTEASREAERFGLKPLTRKRE